MGTKVAKPGDSLSLIAGYPTAGWRDRLDQLIAANQQLATLHHPPDHPQYGRLDVRDVDNVPWLPPPTQ